MKLFNYLTYKLTDRYFFSQRLICDNGYMNKSGVCFGLTVDWLKYDMVNPTHNYVTDKYNTKFKTELTFDWDRNDFLVTHTLNSKNYYNRINYFQKKANLELGKTDIQDLYESESSNITDKAFVILHGESEVGHACAYKIHQQNSGYSYTYFDPNFGETHSIIFEDRDTAINSLQNLVRFEIANYHNLSNGQIDFCNNPAFINDSEKFTIYLNESWKHSKTEIENYGVYENSISYSEFPKHIFEQDYYMAA